ncbi:zinc knuckle [Apiospora kogelbergensis]|uniref:Zinc knuckle n=1 Tax=Apiospora kogelbergensis TaxID=1337665 RepID=A0AAW0QC02_9PEZI
MLDASGVFDNVDHAKLIDCLARRGLPAPIVLWISKWLKDRRTQLKLPEGKSGWITQNYGIPKGSSLSPLLWLFYNADLLNEILGGGSTAVLGSGAAKGAATGAALGTGTPSQQGSSASYPVAGVQGPKTASGTPLEECIQLPGVDPIEPQEKLRHLGVWFDPGLLWHHHIAEIKTKVRKSIQGLKAITGADWGCAPEIVYKDSSPVTF